jgi:hypothetical protein
VSPFLIHLTMMPSTDVSRIHTPFADIQRATAATKPPRADAAAVQDVCPMTQENRASQSR